MPGRRWHPTDDETFVFHHPGTGRRVVVLIPGGEAPNAIEFETDLGKSRFTLDQDATDQTRMFVRVSNRKRGLLDD